MRCPYCGGIVSDRADYCVHCGRNLTQPPPVQPVSRQAPPYPPPSPQGRLAPQQPPYQQSQSPRQAPPSQGRPAAPIPQQPSRQVSPAQGRSAPTAQPPRAAPPAPEAPAPFPPRTVAHLQVLGQGALPYAVINSEVAVGQKKIVRVAYARCVAWQQVATLYKALQEHQEERFTTIIIQGVLEQDTRTYAFTNGQIQFDRNTRLGSLVMNRYQIETGTGFESDSVRIVLTEQIA